MRSTFRMVRMAAGKTACQRRIHVPSASRLLLAEYKGIFSANLLCSYSSFASSVCSTLLLRRSQLVKRTIHWAICFCARRSVGGVCRRIGSAVASHPFTRARLLEKSTNYSPQNSSAFQRRSHIRPAYVCDCALRRSVSTDGLSGRTVRRSQCCNRSEFICSLYRLLLDWTERCESDSERGSTLLRQRRMLQ